MEKNQIKRNSLLEQAILEKKRRESRDLRLMLGKVPRSEIIQLLFPAYEIQEKPKLFHDSTKPDKYLIGGYGSGKTHTFSAEMGFLAYMNRPLDILSVIQTKSNSEATTLKTLEQILRDNNYGYRIEEERGGTYQNLLINFDLNSMEPACMKLASGKVPENLVGPTVAAGGIDEPFIQSEDTFKAVISRIRDPKALINEFVAAGTIEPLQMTWGFEIVDDSFKGDEDTFKIVVTMDDNKFATPEYKARMRRSLSKEMQAVYLDGKNVNLTGTRVYDGITDNSIKPFNTFRWHAGLKRIMLGFDFNVGKMTCGEIALQGKVRTQIDEYVIRNSNTEELCDMIIRRLLEKYPGVTKSKKGDYSIFIAMDAAARQRKSSAKIGSTDATIIRDAFINAGFNVSLHVPLENPPVRDRVNFVNKLAETGRFYITDNCKESILDRKYTKWKEGAAKGFIIDKSNGRSHISEAVDYPLWASQHFVEAVEESENSDIYTEAREERA